MTAWTHKQRIMHKYNQSARIYDTQYSEEQQTKIKTIMQNLTLPQNSHVLDVGCGTGLLIKHLVNKAKLTVCLDISRSLLQEAKAKARPRQNVRLILADADNMPFPEQIFNAAFAITLLQNMPDPDKTLNEIKRVTRQNATIAVTALRKKFTQESFTKTLNQADLKIHTLKTDEKNREYVCICHKKKLGVKSKSTHEPR